MLDKLVTSVFDFVATQERAQARVGERLSRFVLERCMDVDVLGASYLATSDDGQVCDVLVLDDRLRTDDAIRREMTLAAGTAHRVGVASALAHEVGTTAEGVPHYLANVPRGETLAELLRRRTPVMPPAEVLRICADALDILALAHDRNVVHGGIEPRFVYLSEHGVVLIRGFGMHAARRHAATSFYLPLPPGAVSFVAPNQIVGEPPNATSDVWSVTALAVHAMTGQFTYPGASETEREHSATLGRVRHLGQIAPEAPNVLLDLFEYAFDNAVDAHRLAVRFRDAADSRDVRFLRNLHDEAPHRRSRPPEVRGTTVSAPPVPQGPRPRGAYSQMSPAVTPHTATTVPQFEQVQSPPVPVIDKGPANRPPRR